jgi:hypothetical protein
MSEAKKIIRSNILDPPFVSSLIVQIVRNRWRDVHVAAIFASSTPWDARRADGDRGVVLLAFQA